VKKPIKECIIVAKKVNDTVILAKNRDRAYKPELEIVHEIVDGVEIAYLRDTTTDWSEGINEFGIGILNTALMVGFDEIEKKIVKKAGKPTKDGVRIRRALTSRTLKQAVESAALSGVKGHSFVADSMRMVSMETTSMHKPKLDVRDITQNDYVRTNHGFHYYDAGYTKGDDYKSSKIRKLGAEKAIEDAQSGVDILNALKKQMYDKNSNLNMRRDTEKMVTSSQLMLNLKERTLQLDYFKSKVEKFHGVRTILPNDYEPKIKIVVNAVDI